MKQAVLNVIAEMESVFEKAGEDFAFENIYNERVPFDDYARDQVSAERVRDDWDRVTGILERFYQTCRESGEMDDFSFVFAVYCNFFIRKGFYLRLGTEAFEQNSACLAGDEEDRKFYSCFWTGIRTQTYDWFERAWEARPYPVAAMYCFIRYMALFCQNIVEEKATDWQLESRIWKFYEALPADYREYVMGTGKLHRESENLAADENWLPYISTKSMRDYLIGYNREFYLDFLENMKLDPEKVEGGMVADTLIDRLQLRQMWRRVERGSEAIRKCDPQRNEEAANQIMRDMFNDLLRNLATGIGAYGQIQWPLRLLFEKLHTLLLEDTEPRFREGMELPKTVVSPAYRNTYLNIPVLLPGGVTSLYLKSRYDLFKEKCLSDQRLLENKRLSRERQDMMDHYAHSWKHISYPMTVKRVAEELSRTNLPLANRLFKAYNSERTLQGGLQILQYSISDQPDAVRDAFRQGFYCIGAQVGKSIRQVMEESVDLVLFKVLMEEADGSKKISRCRANLQKQHSLEALREQYIRCYIQGEGRQESVLDWFDANVFPLEVSVDELWQEIRIKEDDFSDFQLSELFVELFTNVLTHGTDWCRISLEGGERSMDICVTNAPGEENHGTRMGLKTLGAIVDKINYGAELVGITSGISADNVYGVRIAFDRRIMYRRGRR